jgi:hypothetical protein
MNRREASSGDPPPNELNLADLHGKPRTIRSAIRLNIRGRAIHLPGIRRPPAGVLRWLLILGPGLITSSAGNDAGGIATYSSAGAKFGYDLIWVMVVITVSLAVVQEMCARLGAATGRGLLDLIRERYGIGWALLAMGTLFIANAGVIITEFLGIGAAAELLKLPKMAVVPLAALLLWYLVIFGSYASLEKVFLAMTLVFFAYPVAAVLARPDWGQVAQAHSSLRCSLIRTICSCWWACWERRYLLICCFSSRAQPWNAAWRADTMDRNAPMRIRERFLLILWR